MFRLKVLKGSTTKKEFFLKEGKYIVGRNEDCNIQLPSEGISKKHASLTIKKGRATIEDLGSRNGTFVNGMMCDKRELNSGDKLSFHDFVLEFKRKSVQPQLSHQQVRSSIQKPEAPKWYEPVMDGIIEKVEWKYLTLLFLIIYVAANFAFTIPPLLEENTQKLQQEAVKRGEFIVKNIADQNKKYLRLKDGMLISDSLKLSTGFSKLEQRLLAVDIINPMTKKIIAPPERFDQSISSRSAVLRGSEAKKLLSEKINASRMVISYPIYLYSDKEQSQKVAAIVQAVMNIKGIGLTASEKSTLLLKNFLISFICAVLFYILLQQFTSRAFKNIYKEIETSSKRGYRHLDLHTKFDEMNHIIHSINAVFKRTRDLISKVPESDRMETESSTHNADEILKNLLSHLPEAVVILSEGYEVLQMNPSFENIASLQNAHASEKNIMDIIENQELLRNISHGLGQAALGADSLEELEIDDIRYQIKVSASRTPEDLIDFYIVNLRRLEA